MRLWNIVASSIMLVMWITKELPANIQIVPSDELMSAYEADYNEMKESFIYGQSLTFADMMKRIGALQELFRVHKSDNV